MGRENSGRKDFQSPEVLADAEQILDLKAKGLTDREIKKHMGLETNTYRIRIKYITDSGFFKDEATSLCAETIHRMAYTRRLALDGYKKCLEDSKKANAAASYLKMVIEIDKAIPELAAQLGFIPKIADPIQFVDDEEYKTMPIDQLMEAYRKAIQ